MWANGETVIVPMRAMTGGETLDAAVALLRQRALPLLAVAAPLAIVEQVVLFFWRAVLGLEPPVYWPDEPSLSWWSMISAGFAVEAFVIALLGAYAGAAAGPALLGLRVSHRAVWRRFRPLSAIVLALVLGGVAYAATFGGFLGLILIWLLFGLAPAVLTFDRVRGPLVAIGRSAALSTRAGMRAGGLRLLGYGVWLAIRFALGTGWTAVVGMFGAVPGVQSWMVWAVPAAWAVANTLAYAALACLDAVLVVETRIRTEGLDIAVGRARGRGEDGTAALLVVGR
ncbi:hypothetical protein [Actinoplanes sp. NPDC049802]|uniref:hypothetical protein n=1 Tax=Actinoplanes sp. NPDC049802 TaxID=3154742 RepID=UPI0033F44241